MTVMGPGGMRTAAGAPVQMQLQGNLMAMGPGGQAAGFYDAYNSGACVCVRLSVSPRRPPHLPMTATAVLLTPLRHPDIAQATS